MKRRTVGKKIRCGQVYCSQFGKVQIIEPVSVADGFHSWPAARCNECECTAEFVGYVEKDDPT